MIKSVFSREFSPKPLKRDPFFFLAFLGLLVLPAMSLFIVLSLFSDRHVEILLMSLALGAGVAGGAAISERYLRYKKHVLTARNSGSSRDELGLERLDVMSRCLASKFLREGGVDAGS